MRKLGFALLLLVLVALGDMATAVPDPCWPCPWKKLRGDLTAYLDDCAYLHSLNRQNLESWARGGCGGSLCGATFYTELGCTTGADGRTTASGNLDYRCDCRLQ